MNNNIEYAFDAKKIKAEMVNWIRKVTNGHGIILGISGGKDSTVCAALCAEAVGSNNVLGVLMPNGEQSDIADAKEVCTLLGIKSKIVNIRNTYEAQIRDIESCGITLSNEAKINIPPRIRMSTLYSIGQTMSYRVCGTGNLSERLLAYFTKWGDGSCDFNPIGLVTKEEVVKLGIEGYNLPEHLILKTPSDGLSGMSDEEKLGIKYHYVHNLARGIEDVPDEIVEKIINKIKIGSHKNKKIPIFNPNLSIDLEIKSYLT